MPSGIDFTQLEMFFGVIIAILAVAATCWGGVRAIKEALSPLSNTIRITRETADKVKTLEKDISDIKDEVKDHAGYLDKDKKELERDQKRIDDLEKSNRLVLRGISQLIEHELSGNHTEELRKTHNDIDDYLINR